MCVTFTSRYDPRTPRLLEQSSAAQRGVWCRRTRQGPCGTELFPRRFISQEESSGTTRTSAPRPADRDLNDKQNHPVMESKALLRCKIVVVGDSQCGKTALLHVFAKDSYSEVKTHLLFSENKTHPWIFHQPHKTALRRFNLFTVLA